MHVCLIVRISDVKYYQRGQNYQKNEWKYFFNSSAKYKKVNHSIFETLKMWF